MVEKAPNIHRRAAEAERHEITQTQVVSLFNENHKAKSKKKKKMTTE